MDPNCTVIKQMRIMYQNTLETQKVCKKQQKGPKEWKCPVTMEQFPHPTVIITYAI